MRSRRGGMWAARVLILMMMGIGGVVSGPRRAVGAETGKLRVYAWPVESEIFIDGQHMGDATFDGTLTVPGISPGEHTVGVYCYGFVPQTFQVTIEAGKVIRLDAQLEAIGGTTPGPWGRILFKGSKRAAVLLNGKTPDYEVGHVNEFDATKPFRQELLVHPGTYEVTAVHGEQTIWTGTVTVQANQMTVVRLPGGEQKTEEWKGGAKAGEMPRFRSGVASTTVAVAPVTGEFSANPTEISCGESATLQWKSDGAMKTEISGVGEVAASGQQQVTPKQTTTYTLTAGGPGGVVKQSQTVTMKGIEAKLEVTPTEIRYRRVGEKVVEEGSATLNWSTTGAEAVTVDPLGTVSTSGSQRVQPGPEQTGTGPVDRTVSYTLHATNACGGAETRTATLHLTGSIEPGVSATETTAELGMVLVSVFFPTAHPEAKRPELGLVKSQQGLLARLAQAFKKYLEFDANARLSLEANADQRGSVRYNQSLSERRAARAKGYLVEQGVPAGAIDTVSFGKEKNLSRNEVKELEAKNPHTPPQARLRAAKVDWLAYNRRVDIVLKPAGLRSSQYYPHDAADSNLLWQMPHPRWKAVEAAQ